MQETRKMGERKRGRKEPFSKKFFIKIIYSKKL
jgi:hypothetical protein